MTKWVQPLLLIALVGAGIGLIVFGAVLMCQYQRIELDFQPKLLEKLGPDYHWRAMGDGYFGLGAVIAGTFLMTVAAGLALVSRALERPVAATPDGANPGRRQLDQTKDDRAGPADDSTGCSGKDKHVRCDHAGIWEL